MGHQQLQLTKTHWQFRYNHGGILRKKRQGRKARPISTRAPIHLVFKTNVNSLRRGLRSPLGYFLIHSIVKKYARRFFVKIEQVAINHDHLHLMVRFSRRSQGLYFLRVVAGQIAQEFQKNGFLKSAVVTDTPEATQKVLKLWKHRPFTRVIQGWRSYLTVRNYIQLNKKEASGQIRYKPQRLRGLSSSEWEILWE
ncbi:MAG: transposase [Pseudobdellovibrio sp.]|nr:transposase [Pseudobdellovibrio sp.]